MYDYILRAYGVNVQPGDKVMLSELDNLPGVVIAEDTSASHYVHVQWKNEAGNTCKGLFHPNSIEQVRT